jgi:hypothetical protein
MLGASRRQTSIRRMNDHGMAERKGDIGSDTSRRCVKKNHRVAILDGVKRELNGCQ